MAEEQEKEEAIRELTGMAEAAKKVETEVKDLARRSREVLDTIPLVCDVLTEYPAAMLPASQLSNIARGAREFMARANEITDFLRMGAFGPLASGVTNTSSTIVYGPIVFADIPVEKVKVIQNKKEQLSKALDKTKQAEQANESFRRLGLSIRKDKRRIPADLLAESTAALNLPGVGDGRPTSILVSLRECINAVFAMLLLRRPQEPTGKFHLKVESIGRQCGKDGLTNAHFERLGKEGEALHDKLSTFKQDPLSRDEMMGYYYQGLIFLNAFMDSIDEKKFR